MLCRHDGILNPAFIIRPEPALIIVGAPFLALSIVCLLIYYDDDDDDDRDIRNLPIFAHCHTETQYSRV